MQYNNNLCEQKQHIVVTQEGWVQAAMELDFVFRLDHYKRVQLVNIYFIISRTILFELWLFSLPLITFVDALFFIYFQRISWDDSKIEHCGNYSSSYSHTVISLGLVFFNKRLRYGKTTEKCWYKIKINFFCFRSLWSGSEMRKKWGFTICKERDSILNSVSLLFCFMFFVVVFFIV